ncbi:MAG: SDR family NAD(P)-dependent oxidoreductase, partial [Bacteroidetes bacterium]
MGTKPAQNVHFTKIRNGFHQQIPRASVRLQYLPSPDFIEFAPQLSLITNDGSPLTLAVAEKLQQAGNQVVILNLPFVNNFALPSHFKTINLESANDLGAKQAIEKLNYFGKIGNFIHLNPHFANSKNLGQHFETETNLLKTVFSLAKHLSKPLNESGKTSRTNFLTISRIDGNLGLKNANSSVFAGGLSGIVKCINIEWQSVFCRAVDIDPKNAISQASEQIFAELHDSNLQIIEVAYQGNLRQTLIAKREILQENVEKNSKITTKSVFLVSGGAKGVTADCVLKMAEVYQCKFILLGRSSNDFAEPTWAKGITSEADLKKLAMQDLISKGEKPTPILVQKAVNQVVAKREIDESLQAIRNFGSQVEYLAVDVLNADSIKNMLPKAVQKLGNITGIIHGAGRLADKLIDNKTDSDFEAVYTVKVKGLLNLLDCVDIKEMQQIVLFSSVAGFFGNTGQTDYSMANEILSKSAHFLKNHYPNL